MSPVPTSLADRSAAAELVDSSPAFAVVLDGLGLLRWASPSVADGLGWTDDVLIGLLGSRLIHPADLERLLQRATGRVGATLPAVLTGDADTAAAAGGADTAPAPGDAAEEPDLVRWRAADGSWHLAVSIAVDLRGDARVGGVVVHGWDVTEFRSLRPGLGLTDSLTGLPNRRLLEDRLRLAQARAARTRQPVAVMFVDLDGFKEINDSGGHAAGDAVLSAVGARMAATLRPDDTVARWGGDEFVVVCEQVGGLRDAQAVASRLLAEIRRPLAIAPTVTVEVSASVGVAVSADPRLSVETLLTAADQAMYRHKRGASGPILVLLDQDSATDVTAEAARRAPTR